MVSEMLNKLLNIILKQISIKWHPNYIYVEANCNSTLWTNSACIITSIILKIVPITNPHLVRIRRTTCSKAI